MAISPFSVRPASPDGERRRARLALMIAAVGIVAIVAAYAISPGVRHAVSHAEHSVKHAVGNVFHHRHGASARSRRAHHRLHLVQPLRVGALHRPRHGHAPPAGAGSTP
jgi:hypothetical protein